MNDSNRPFEDPELHKLLARQPHPAAPPGLAMNVLSRLQQDLRIATPAQPWWKLPLQKWPIAAQTPAWMGLITTAVAILSAPLWLPSLIGTFSPALGQSPWLSGGMAAAALLDGALSAARSLAAQIPSLLWIGILATFLMTYAAALGAGAWAYRHHWPEDHG